MTLIRYIDSVQQKNQKLVSTFYYKLHSDQQQSSSTYFTSSLYSEAYNTICTRATNLNFIKLITYYVVV